MAMRVRETAADQRYVCRSRGRPGDCGRVMGLFEASARTTGRDGGALEEGEAPGVEFVSGSMSGRGSIKCL